MALPVVEVGLHNAVWPVYLDIELSAKKNKLNALVVQHKHIR